MRKYRNTNICNICFLLLSSLFLLYACTPRRVEKAITLTFRSFVGRYAFVGEDLFLESPVERAITLKGRIIGSSVYDDKREDKIRIYDSLCLKNGDMSYNRSVSGMPKPLGIVASGVNFIKTDITCTRDFSAGLPAGSSLAGIVRFMSSSLYPFIKSGYTKTYDYTQELPEPYKSLGQKYVHLYFEEYSQFRPLSKTEAPLFPINKIATELNKEDLTLVGLWESGVGNIGTLYFEELPETSGEYEIVVKLYGDDGKTYSGSIVMNF